MSSDLKSLARKIGPWCSKVPGLPSILYGSWNSNKLPATGEASAVVYPEPAHTPPKQIYIVTHVPPWERTIKSTERKIINMSSNKHLL